MKKKQIGLGLLCVGLLSAVGTARGQKIEIDGEDFQRMKTRIAVLEKEADSLARRLNRLEKIEVKYDKLKETLEADKEKTRRKVREELEKEYRKKTDSVAAAWETRGKTDRLRLDSLERACRQKDSLLERQTAIVETIREDFIRTNGGYAELPFARMSAGGIEAIRKNGAYIDDPQVRDIVEKVSALEPHYRLYLQLKAFPTQPYDKKRQDEIEAGIRADSVCNAVQKAELDSLSGQFNRYRMGINCFHTVLSELKAKIQEIGEPDADQVDQVIKEFLKKQCADNDLYIERIPYLQTRYREYKEKWHLAGASSGEPLNALPDTRAIENEIDRLYKEIN